MTRSALLLVSVLATLAAALPAAAAPAHPFRGVLVTVADDAVAIKNAKNVTTTCARTANSPSLTGYAAGDPVQAACASNGKRLVLLHIEHLATPAAPASDFEPTRFAGAVTALTDSSISLHDGDRDLTCSLGAASPATDGVKVGQHVKVTCANGVLVTLAPVTPVDAGRAYEGSVSAVSATSITVHTAHGDGTCSVSDGSPSVAGVRVGDRVLAGCRVATNQLVLLKKLPPNADPPPGPAPAPTPVPPTGSGDAHPAVTVGGILSALSATSLTVHGEHGEVTCSVGPDQRLGDFHVGDHVGMACVDGALLKLVELP